MVAAMAINLEVSVADKGEVALPQSSRRRADIIQLI
jgi:hypothetical protein